MDELKILAEVKGKPLQEKERENLAIELAALLLDASYSEETLQEEKKREELGELILDPYGRALFTAITDECFRSKNLARASNQLRFLLTKYGIPKFLSWEKKLALLIFKIPFFMPLAKKMIQKEASSTIVSSENLQKYLEKKAQEKIQVNLNRLGEAILGEEEAEKRLELYLADLQNPLINYISVKISTLFSQINLLSYRDTLEKLKKPLRMLYKAAQEHGHKFVNLDMEEYRDLHLTLDLFTQVLEEPSFFKFSAGLVLQSYLPEAFILQEHLTHWAKERVSKGGAPIKLRIVKGANLGMERVEASLRGWEQATFSTKKETDANFIKMIRYGLEPENAKAVHIGVGSHNLFDIAYALILRSEKGVENWVDFEMLQGMGMSTQKVVQQVAGGLTLYSPVASQEEFQYAVAYLMRRLDENTGEENFLRYALTMTLSSKEWKIEKEKFKESCSFTTLTHYPRRDQNRLEEKKKELSCFENEPDTDWTLPHNRVWGEGIIKEWHNKILPPIPLVINGREKEGNFKNGIDPSYPDKTRYLYSLATERDLEEALQCAKKVYQPLSPALLEKRKQFLKRLADQLRQGRANLIGAMVADTGKTIAEADVEVSEAVDFAEYYLENINHFTSFKEIRWESKGVVLVAPPWNFPCSIPAGGLIAALITGNSVLFKPALEAPLVGYELVKIFYEAGISKEELQFIPCEDEPEGTHLIKDSRIATVLLTGGTATAKHFIRTRPGLDLIAETGGKNSLIVTALVDRDLSIKDALQSAFNHAGQKCSALSLLILEKEVYEDKNYKNALRDATLSLPVGSPWNLISKITPLIRPPEGFLKEAMNTLEEGESWLVEPKADPHNPHLFSPGIKWGVTEKSLTYKNELFGPILAVMCAEDLPHALKLANGTRYGLTAGLHSLDEREHSYWLKHIQAGNCYINRGITGAIVQRQPFGGCKESSFGPGAKVGGPNYLLQLLKKEELISLTKSYKEYYESFFSQKHFLKLTLGESNYLKYIPLEKITLRVQSKDNLEDAMRVKEAAKVCKTPLEISLESNESDEELVARMLQGKVKRLRTISPASLTLKKGAAEAFVVLIEDPVLTHGRFELLHYLREVSVSTTTHRYGYISWF